MKKWTTFAAIAILGAGATSLALRGQTAAVAETRAAPVAAPVATVAFGKPVAPLALLDTAGKSVTVGDWNKSKATVLMFIATKCPVSNDYNARMAALGKDYASKGIKFVGINSNKAEPGSEVATHTKANGFTFPVYKDPQNKIADRFDAKVTPEVYIVGPKGDLLYRGRIDNAQKGEVKEPSLKLALDAVVAGKPIAEKETRAFGCSIKREG